MEEFRSASKTGFDYQMETPVQSRLSRSMSVKPGSLISSSSHIEYSFMFSGTMINNETGITVAHPLMVGQKVMTVRDQSQNVRRVIGQCCEKHEEVRVEDRTFTVDMAVLTLRRGFRVQRNFVWHNGREFPVKIYRRKILEKTKVMVLDQNGVFQYGIIRRVDLNDRKPWNNLHNVFGIEKEDSQEAITDEGDSGALVLSVPSQTDDVLYVYGIVISIYYEEDRETPDHENSLTIANSLGVIIPEVFKGRQPDAIDFM